MAELLENIEACKTTRGLAAQAVAEVLHSGEISETQFCGQVAEKLYKHPNWDQGWYSPPPKGVAALFGPENNVGRLAYDNLRKPEFWPQNNIFAGQSLGYVYASPVNKASGIIGDFGLTIYRGTDQKIIDHLKRCLLITEKTAEYAQVGMEFGEVYNYCLKLMAEHGLNNQRMLAISSSVKNNIGHTVPWSHELPTEEELKIITGQDFEKLKALISSKRINLNSEELFKIPSTIAFTVEPRMENNNSPMTSFHIIVAFMDGKKEIFGNFNPVFKSLNMETFITGNY